MADISRNTTPAWQDPHLKDRGDYTEQDIQNIQEKGGILPDFTLDEAEETHLFARVAQALSKTLTRQGLAVRHEAKAAAEPMGYRLDEHAIAIDTRRPWKDIALDLAHALGAIQVARDALNPADQPQGAAEWNRYKDKGRMVGDQLLASIGLLNSHWHENRGVIRAHALQARKAAGRPDLQFRTLRVTHATRLMLDGSSLKETMDALGHVREETTLRHYLRAVPEHQREAAERTAAYLLSADPSLAIASLPPAPVGLDADGDAGDMAALALLLGQVSTLMAGIAARNAQPAG